MYDIKNNLKEQIQWLNKFKYDEKCGILSGFRIINENHKNQFDLSSNVCKFTYLIEMLF